MAVRSPDDLHAELLKRAQSLSRKLTVLVVTVAPLGAWRVYLAVGDMGPGGYFVARLFGITGGVAIVGTFCAVLAAGVSLSKRVLLSRIRAWAEKRRSSTTCPKASSTTSSRCTKPPRSLLTTRIPDRTRDRARGPKRLRSTRGGRRRDTPQRRRRRFRTRAARKSARDVMSRQPSHLSLAWEMGDG